MGTLFRNQKLIRLPTFGALLSGSFRESGTEFRAYRFSKEGRGLGLGFADMI